MPDFPEPIQPNKPHKQKIPRRGNFEELGVDDDFLELEDDDPEPIQPNKPKMKLLRRGNFLSSKSGKYGENRGKLLLS